MIVGDQVKRDARHLEAIIRISSHPKGSINYRSRGLLRFVVLLEQQSVGVFEEELVLHHLQVA